MDFTSIDFSQVGQVGIIILFVLYLVWDIIKRLLNKSDLWKLKEKELKEKTKTNKILKSLDDNLAKQSIINQKVTDYLKTIQQRYTDDINKEQYRIFMYRLTKTAQQSILLFGIDVIHKNHISNNKDVITNKFKTKITTLFNKDLVDMKQFKLNGICISTFMNNSWINEITVGIVSAIYDYDNREDKIKQLKFFITSKFQSIYNEFLNKINE